MLKFCSSFCDLNDWSLAQLQNNEQSWNIFLKRNQELASFIRKQNLRGFFEIHKNSISLKMATYRHYWSKYNHIWIEAILRDFQFKFDFYVSVYITFFPVYPRDIEKRRFLVPHTDDLDIVKSIIAHELLHFMFFSKYKGVVDQEIWLVSELLVPLYFSYLMQQHSEMGELYSSNYCLSDKMIVSGSYVFERYIEKKLSFSEMILQLIQIVK